MLHAGIGRKDYNLLSLFVQGIKLLVQKTIVSYSLFRIFSGLLRTFVSSKTNE